MAIFFNIPNATVAILMQVKNALMEICLHVRMRASLRDAAGFSNPGGLAVMWWAYSVPLVVRGLSELLNSGWAKAHPAHPLAASLPKETQIS